MIFVSVCILDLTQGWTGEVVFVDVTADWWLTCEALVLGQYPVASALGAFGITPMQADRACLDKAISHYLKRLCRFGIPFNVVCSPGAPAEIVLPELLTADADLDALERAGARALSRIE